MTLFHVPGPSSPRLAFGGLCKGLSTSLGAKLFLWRTHFCMVPKDTIRKPTIFRVSELGSKPNRRTAVLLEIGLGEWCALIAGSSIRRNPCLTCTRMHQVVRRLLDPILCKVLFEEKYRTHDCELDSPPFAVESQVKPSRVAPRKQNLVSYYTGNWTHVSVSKVDVLNIASKPTTATTWDIGILTRLPPAAADPRRICRENPRGACGG